MKTDLPPSWPGSILRFCCQEYLIEEIEGDLEESYFEWVQLHGEKRAKWLYIIHAFKFLRPYALKRPEVKLKINTISMLMNNLRTARRHLIKGRGYTALNVLSLSLGLSAFMAIALWIQSERSVDTFHENRDQLYSLYYTEKGADNTLGGYPIPFEFVSPEWNLNNALSEQLKQAIPGIKYAAEYHPLYELPWGYAHTFRAGEEIHKMEGAMVTKDFLDMFSFKKVAGTNGNPFSDAHHVVISRKMAELFFDSPQNAVGQLLRYENKLNLVVTAVIENIQSNSSMQFDYLLNWELNTQGKISRARNQWQTFLQLQENADRQIVNQQIYGFLDERLSEYPDVKVSLGMMAFSDKYLYSTFENGIPVGGKIDYLYTFSGVAICILLLACINFAGLATARSVKRSREIGVRKVMGSSRLELTTQFLTESILLSLMSVIIAIGIVVSTLPILNRLMDLSISLPYADLRAWTFVLILSIVVGVVAGGYPSLFLSSQKVTTVIKRDFKFSPTTVMMQKGLVILQSVLAVVMLLVTVVVYQQTSYVKNSDLGYDRANVIYVPIEGELIEKYHLLKNELEKMPGIQIVDRSSEAPHAMNFETISPINWQGKQPGDKVGFYPTSVGFDYIDMMQLEVVEGRGFSRSISSDSNSFVINEMAVKQMGIEAPIGKWISAWDKKGTIIGILKDYHINSLHQPIKPVIMDVKEDLTFGNLLVKTNPGQTRTAILSIEETLAKINPNYAVEYEFMDTEYAKLYRYEETVSSLANVFTIISLIICCLGLFGLAMTSAEQRIKEIGIRKVLGASLLDIIRIFSNSFLKLTVISILIAIPIAWWLLDDWLSGFAYHIS
ncbi:MAG: ABC transporter permease, partial [Bacteroidota bacterium]